MDTATALVCVEDYAAILMSSKLVHTNVQRDPDLFADDVSPLWPLMVLLSRLSA